jgi:Holliday junction resolvasome RuvABC endonuclease subunit
MCSILTEKGYSIIACLNNKLYNLAFVTSNQSDAERFASSIKSMYDHVRIIDGRAKLSNFFIEDNIIFRKR